MSQSNDTVTWIDCIGQRINVGDLVIARRSGYKIGIAKKLSMKHDDFIGDYPIIVFENGSTATAEYLLDLTALGITTVPERTDCSIKSDLMGNQLNVGDVVLGYHNQLICWRKGIVQKNNCKNM